MLYRKLNVIDARVCSQINLRQTKRLALVVSSNFGPSSIAQRTLALTSNPLRSLSGLRAPTALLLLREGLPLELVEHAAGAAARMEAAPSSPPRPRTEVGFTVGIEPEPQVQQSI